MNTIKIRFRLSVRFTVACMGMAAVWLFAPEIVQAAVTFGEIGQNIADNSKGVAKGITMAGYAAGAGMGLWGTVDMYKATQKPGTKHLRGRTDQGDHRRVGTWPGRISRFRFRHSFRFRPDFRHGRIGSVSVRR